MAKKVTKKVTAKRAVEAAREAGEEIQTVKDEEGNEFEQRPFDIDDIPEQEEVEGERVMVMSVYNARIFLSDGHINYKERREVLVSDYTLCNRHEERLVKVAQ